MSGTPVDTGFDYHLAEVVRLDLREYVAQCDACNWRGPFRETRAEADADCLAHDTASNPPSNR